MRVLRIPRGESGISFFQERHSLGRGNNRPIGMSRISRSGKLACDQADDDDAGYELCLSHAGVLGDVACVVNSKLRSERRRTSMNCKQIPDQGNDQRNANNPPDCFKSRWFYLGSELLPDEVVVVELVLR